MMAVDNVYQRVADVLENIFHLIMQRRGTLSGGHTFDHRSDQEGCD